jgi:hypothetical protein
VSDVGRRSEHARAPAVDHHHPRVACELYCVLVDAAASGTAVEPHAAEAEHAPTEKAEPAPESWPAVSAGTSVSGIVGGLITLALAGVVGLALKARPMQRASGNG